MQGFERIQHIVREVIGLLGGLTVEDTDVLDTLDLCELILDIEETLDILIEDEANIRSVADLIRHVENTVA